MLGRMMKSAVSYDEASVRAMPVNSPSRSNHEVRNRLVATASARFSAQTTAATADGRRETDREDE